MAKVSRTRGSASNIFDVFIQDSSSTTGAGLGSVAFGSSGLTIKSKRELDNDWASLTPQDITTIGTFAAPSAASIRFKASGASAPTGSYQLMVLDALLGTGDASRWAQISITGVTNMAPLILEIDLDPQVDVKFWNGTVVASPATAGIPEVNVKNINNVSTSAVTTVNANQGTTGVVTFTVSAQVDCNVKDWAGTAVSAPATAGIPEVNNKNVNNVSASSDTTVNANQGTTQPINFTGTAGSALVKGDTVDWNGTAVSTPATAGIPEVNVKNMNNVSAAAITTVKAVQGLSTADTVVTVSGNVNGSVGSVTGAVGSVTGNVGGSVASVTAGVTIASSGLDSGALTAAAKNAVADSVLDRNMATGTDSGTDSTATRTPRQALRILRNKASIAAGTLTCTKEDDTTASWTASVTTTAGNPITTVDPT